MSTMEISQVKHIPAEYVFERMLQNIFTDISFRANEKKLQLSVEIDKKIPYSLFGDEFLLSQVISHLLENAVRFAPVKGDIRFTAKLASEEDGICNLRILVKDSGFGIAPELQEDLFTNPENKLSVIRHTVEVMGGRIGVESDPIKGTKFVFTTKAERRERSPRSLLAPGINWNNIRILIVDDIEQIRTQFLETFTYLGIHCDAAADGIEAVEIIDKNGDYDIYFIDWWMPKMDGIQLTKWIKTHKTKHPSVVTMITALEWNDIRENAYRAGVDKCLLKPILSAMLIDCVNECLGGAKHSGEFAGMNLLLVEDIEFNREVITALLEDTGLLIDSATNGEIAIEMVKAAPDKYDIIFMDIEMPVMDGLAATRHIRDYETAEGKRKQPIIALTANVHEEDIERCFAAGMDGHLCKPLDLDKILEILRRFLHKNG